MTDPIARRRGGRRGQHTPRTPARARNYRQLTNPFAPLRAFSDDHIAAMHHAALDVLETEGMKVLLPDKVPFIYARGSRQSAESFEMLAAVRRLSDDACRAATGSASNLNDMQAANETQMGAWGCLMAGVTVVIHAAGWLEGGLTVSSEKLITDVEVLNMVAELCCDGGTGSNDMAQDDIAGHTAAGGAAPVS